MKEGTKQAIGEFAEEYNYYLSTPNGIKTLMAISTFIIAFTALTYISVLRVIILITFGLTLLMLILRYRNINKHG